MDHEQGAMAEVVRRLGLRSERFLEAAECLPASPAFDSPRGELLALAVEYRLKAYLSAARGGAPYGADLDRLSVLARYCGLTLGPAEQQTIAALDRFRSSGDDAVGEPETARVRDVCQAIASQTAEAG